VNEKPGEKIACIGGTRVYLPEDCGGIDGYYQLTEVLINPWDVDI
jgi:hypothetical protein